MGGFWIGVKWWGNTVNGAWIMHSISVAFFAFSVCGLFMGLLFAHSPFTVWTLVTRQIELWALGH